MKTTFRLLVALMLGLALSNTSCQPTDYSSEINALKASRDSLAAALKIITANVQSTNNSLAGLSSSVTAIQTQLSVISGQIATMNAQLTAANATVSGHTAAISTIQSQIKTIQDQIAVLNSQQSSTSSIVSNLSSSLTSIQTQITSVLNQVATLNSQQSASGTNLSAISAELKLSNSQLNNLSIQLNAILIQLGMVIDADGNTYNTITIGTQVWMASNLKTTKYNDNSVIPLVADSTWGNLLTPGYCWYDNSASTYKNTYGGLYNWFTVNTGKLCPTGWHVPTDADWTALTTFLGGESVAGGKLKANGPSLWFSPNAGATNETGFTALPGGYRNYDGRFFGSFGSYGNWWTFTEETTYFAWYREMGYDYSNVARDFNTKQYGFSVRCLRNN
jgi:uncharacterized protein (TIGR02145 family)